MMSDGRERFFREIAERLPADRIEEVHVFPAIRQGPHESAVAVIAVRPAPPAIDAPPPDPGASDTPDAAASALPDAPPRLTVYRAHYRLTLKGPERGQWESGVVEEADAPAGTVDDVVRGVHERAGGDDEPERLTGGAFRAALGEEPWTATT